MNRKTAVLFPGQGSQYRGMGEFLYNHFTEAKLIFEEANDTLGFDIKRMCFEGDPHLLASTENAQPAILTAGYASYQIFQKSMGFQPQFMAGHSLGEYTALACAEAISFSDALKIVQKRGWLMQEASLSAPGAMAAINNVSADIVRKCCEVSGRKEMVVMANYNSPMQTVISGSRKAVEKAAQSLQEKGAGVVYLDMNGAFHSPLMEKPAEGLYAELQKYAFQEAKTPVISNVDVCIYRSGNEIINGLRRQMNSPVRWTEIMNFLEREDVEIAIDVGPKAVIRNISRSNSGIFFTYSLDNADDRRKLREELSRQNAAHIEKALALAVSEKNMNRDDDEYRKGAIIPYQEVKQLYMKKKSKKALFHTTEVKKAMEMLQKVLDTKKVPEGMKHEHISQLLS
ncbi:MAG: ACP S-malonyltransferase [bacterium]